MQIKDINSTIEKIENLSIYPAGYDSFVVFYARVKKTDWKHFHKLVVKIPAIKSQLSEVSKTQIAEIAIKKMQEVLKETNKEPD